MSNFDDLVEEIKQSDPEEWEAAKKLAKEYFDKVRSGEITLDIKELYIDEDGNLKEVE